MWEISNRRKVDPKIAIQEVRLKKFHKWTVTGISNVKVFLKAHLRIQSFWKALPDCPLPPEPVLTRWSSWIEAATHYCDHFDDIKKVIMEFNFIVSKRVVDAQDYFQQKHFKHDLAYIKTHFSISKTSLTRLETIDLTLSQFLDIVKQLYKRLEDTPGRLGEMAFKKLQDTLQKYRVPRA
ncbi:hypothetical protein Zmor_010335 [Zophobas morio]|uniref:Uncharacterized protein n=1 Tax=Zophobas morio TaxID=2755281 RepID=A0AA38INK7_9CUCU|nr:hypothetical protein Zmor_010335 [Zophobas morio]